MRRREFFGRAAAILGATAVGGATLDPRALAALTRGGASGTAFDALGVQLYTVRSLMSESVPDTLAAVAEIGYREVETAGLYDHAPAEFRALLDANGLRAPSMHMGLGAIEPDALDATLETAATLGASWVIVPSLGRDQLSPEGLPAVIDTLNRAGDRARSMGIGVGFHNHAAEFEPWADGRFPMQVMIEGTDPDAVSFQMDIFWTVHAGHDPLIGLQMNPGRFASVHVKDRTPEGEMVPVGQGVIDFATILPAAEAAGVRHAFVEHDRPADPHAAIASSYDHLREILDIA